MPIAAAEWAAKNCNAAGDGESIIVVTKAINGGLIGLAEPKQRLRKTKAVWH